MNASVNDPSSNNSNSIVIVECAEPQLMLGDGARTEMIQQRSAGNGVGMGNKMVGMGGTIDGTCWDGWERGTGLAVWAGDGDDFHPVQVSSGLGMGMISIPCRSLVGWGWGGFPSRAGF